MAAATATGGSPVRWTGAGYIPARSVGYWSATIPLVLVRLDRGVLTLRVRPTFFGRLVGAKVLTATPGDGMKTYLVRNSAYFQGIEFRPVKGSSFYFFTRHRYAVAEALASSGFTVSEQPGREQPVWYTPDDD